MSKGNGPIDLSGEMGGLIKVEIITPAAARSLLDRDSKNRRIRPGTVTRYASDMAAGRWQLNGETLKIAKNGDVLDGQHRLEACVEAATTFQTVIAYDLPASAFRTIDNGAQRTLTDLLYLKDTQYATIVGASAGYVMYWDTADEKARMRITRPYYQDRPTRDQKFEWLEKSNPKVWQTAGAMACRFQGLAPPSIVAAAYYIAVRGNRSKGEEFFEQMVSGVGVFQDDNPVTTLRKRLIREQSKRVPAAPWEKFSWFMKAWSAFLAERPLKILRVKTRGPRERAVELPEQATA